MATMEMDEVSIIENMNILQQWKQSHKKSGFTMGSNDWIAIEILKLHVFQQRSKLDSNLCWVEM